jgi:hypothetical protein
MQEIGEFGHWLAIDTTLMADTRKKSIFFSQDLELINIWDMENEIEEYRLKVEKMEK